VFFFFGVLRLAETLEPGLKKKFPILSGKGAGTTEPDYKPPSTAVLLSRQIALGVKLAPTAGLALPATAMSKSIF
jgi:hypothetical protein